MKNAIILTEEELTIIVENAVRKVLKEEDAKPKKVITTEEKLLNVKQAAEVLNLSVSTIYSKTSNLLIPFLKESKKLYFKESQLLKWLEDNKK